MKLIACSSLFQLFVAIAIKKHFLSNEDVDLILTDSTPSFKEISKNERLNQIFNSVYFSEINKNSENLNRLQRSKYGKMFYEIFPKKYAKKIWGINLKKYTGFYFSSYTMPNVMMQHAIKRKNKNSHIHFYEDGISSYLLGNKQNFRCGKLLGKIFNISPVEKNVEDLYVFEPSLVCVDGYKKIIKIPNINTLGVLEDINSVFNYADIDIKEKFVFFEESFNNDGYQTNDVDLIYDLYEFCDGKDFILKHHPRNKKDRFKTLLPTIEKFIMWENYLLNKDIENKVLVTVSSNTVFVPKIIFDQQPTVVMLFKIFNGTSPIFDSGNFERYLENYLKFYSEYSKSKIYIPESIDEYKEIILILKKEV